MLVKLAAAGMTSQWRPQRRLPATFARRARSCILVQRLRSPGRCDGLGRPIDFWRLLSSRGEETAQARIQV